MRDNCDGQKPPKNGALACLSATQSVGAKMCQVYCQNGFEFSYRPAQMYYCSKGRWNTWPPFGHGSSFPWPDCASNVILQIISNNISEF